MNKSQLDEIMLMYDYKKNSIDDTLDFLSFMFDKYEKLIVKE